MNPFNPRITIDEMADNVGTWRAVVRVPWSMAHLPGISGGGTDEGPWVAGTGGSPDMALQRAFEHIGRATVRLSLEEEPEKEP